MTTLARSGWGTLATCLFGVLLGGCGGNRKDDLVESGEPAPLPEFEAETKLRKSWSPSVGNGQGKKKNEDRLTLGFLRGAGGGQDVVVASLFAGIGFTMSLFVVTASFDDQVRASAAKLGVLIGSALSALLATMVLCLSKRNLKYP